MCKPPLMIKLTVRTWLAVVLWTFLSAPIAFATDFHTGTLRDRTHLQDVLHFCGATGFAWLADLLMGRNARIHRSATGAVLLIRTAIFASSAAARISPVLRIVCAVTMACSAMLQKPVGFVASRGRCAAPTSRLRVAVSLSNAADSAIFNVYRSTVGRFVSTSRGRRLAMAVSPHRQTRLKLAAGSPI